MEIGVVVHGPGIVDSGWAKKIIDILSNFGNVHCRLGGTMGRTAVIDAGLEDMIDISLKLLPSQSLELFNRELVDVIFLLNYGKSAETGRVFGYKVFNHYFKQISNEDFLATNHKSLYESAIPVIQIERPGEEDGSIISWNVTLNEQLSKSRKSKRAKLLGKKNMVESLSFNFEELFEGLRISLDLKEVKPEEVFSQYFSNNQERQDEKSIEEIIQSYEDFNTSHYTYRKIHGVSPNENIFVNGIVVGRSNADSIVLIARDGLIVDIINATVKLHGVEKLGPVDLDRVIVKTGLLRKSDEVNPRILSKEDVSIKETERYLYSGEISEDDYSFKIAYVDHAAYDIYKFKDFDLVVTVGDDTSLVASDILYRFDIPIIAITDGDLDKVVESGFVNEKSSFIEVASGFDDIVGHYIHETLFLSKDTFEIPFDEGAESIEEFKSIMFKLFKSRILEKVKDIAPSFIEKDNAYNVVSSYQEVIAEDSNLDENLDEFIDEFESADYEGEEIYYEEVPVEEVYLDDNFDASSEEIYVDHALDGDFEASSGEVYVEHDLEEISDAQLEEIIVEHIGDETYSDEDIYVEHDSQEYEEVFIDHGHEEYDDIYVEPSSAEYEEVYFEENAYEVPQDEFVEEIYVDHGSDGHPVEEIYVEHDAHEEIIYEDLPVEEVFIEENADEIDSVESDDNIEEVVIVESKEEVDDAEGWAEYLEDEFGDSLEESEESDIGDKSQ